MEKGTAKNQGKKKIITAGIIVAVLVAVILLITQVLIPRNAYLLAEDLVAAGKNGEAAIAFQNLGHYSDSAQRVEALLEENPAIAFALAAQGSIVTYGTYEQDNDLTNGSEPIEWIVLAKEEGRILALSKNILDVRQYHGYENKVLWQSAAVTKWLNLDFAGTAFADADRAVVESAALLSGEELALLGESSIAALPTAYAQASGLTENAWWLRENETYNGSMTAATVDNSGNAGAAQITDVLGIRPAIWILTDAAQIEENAAAVEDALQSRQRAYESALAMKYMGKYEEAANSFAMLGDYQDAAEQYQSCMKTVQAQGITAEELASAMQESLASAYALAGEVNSDSITAKELQVICTTYYPYCGSFTFEVSGRKVTVESDFIYDNENTVLYWVCEQGEDSAFMAEVNGEVYTFFQDWGTVYGMTATEQYGDKEAKVTFSDNVITCVLGEYQTVTLDDDGGIVSREDYHQNKVLTGTPVS